MFSNCSNKIAATMKTVLLPTDLQIESLNLLNQAIYKNSGSLLNIILAAGIRTPNSIMELLFPSVDEESLVPTNFKTAYQIIKNRNASVVNSIRVEFFRGLTRNAARNFINAKCVDEIFLPRDYKLKLNIPEIFDIVSLLKGHSVKTFEVAWTSPQHMVEKDLFSELFLLGPEFKS